MATLKPELKAILDRYGIDPMAPNACTVWPGTKRAGYGLVTRKGKNIQATRWIWESARGAIPHGLHVMHVCDNPSCVNLRHLRVGTASDNMRDMVAKGRNVPGRKGLSRLGQAGLLELHRRLSEGERQIPLAKEFGISQSYVSRIKVMMNAQNS